MSLGVDVPKAPLRSCVWVHAWSRAVSTVVDERPTPVVCTGAATVPAPTPYSPTCAIHSGDAMYAARKARRSLSKGYVPASPVEKNTGTMRGAAITGPPRFATCGSTGRNAGYGAGGPVSTPVSTGATKVSATSSTASVEAAPSVLASAPSVRELPHPARCPRSSAAARTFVAACMGGGVP